MEKITKPKPEEPKEESKEFRYDSSGKKIATSWRSKDAESALLAINDKMDQLIGILTSTLPTRLSTELRESMAGGQSLENLAQIISCELPDRIQKDSDQNLFQKAEMLSMVISNGMQHLQDAFASSQEAVVRAIEQLSRLEEETTRTLKEVNSLLLELKNTSITGKVQVEHAREVPAPADEKLVQSEPGEGKKEPLLKDTFTEKEEAAPPSPFSVPSSTAPEPLSPWPQRESKPSVEPIPGEKKESTGTKWESYGFGWPPPAPSGEPDKPQSGTS